MKVYTGDTSALSFYCGWNPCLANDCIYPKLERSTAHASSHQGWITWWVFNRDRDFFTYKVQGSGSTTACLFLLRIEQCSLQQAWRSTGLIHVWWTTASNNASPYYNFLLFSSLSISENQPLRPPENESGIRQESCHPGIISLLSWYSPHLLWNKLITLIRRPAPAQQAVDYFRHRDVTCSSTLTKVFRMSSDRWSCLPGPCRSRAHI